MTSAAVYFETLSHGHPTRRGADAVGCNATAHAEVISLDSLGFGSVYTGGQLAGDAQPRRLTL